MRASLALFLAVGLLVPAHSSLAGQAQADALDPPGTSDVVDRGVAGELLATALAGPRAAISGTVAVIVLDEDGPYVSELDVSVTGSGQMVVGRRASFSVGRDGDDAFLARDGTLLELGNVVDRDDPVAAILANYVVALVGKENLETGPAVGIDLIDRQGVRRERLWTDDRSGVIVRRETYDLAGHPRRLVAFTSLSMLAPSVPAMASGNDDLIMSTGPVHELDGAALATMDKTGWHVPAELPGAFRLTGAFALDNGDGRSSLHLVYSDGLYSVSLYEQPGAMAAEALIGAVPVPGSHHDVWRWPGSQPERLVWSYADMTFTAVGDATSDQMLASLALLPGAERVSAATRVRRGLGRVGSWLNPFA